LLAQGQIGRSGLWRDTPYIRSGVLRFYSLPVTLGLLAKQYSNRIFVATALGWFVVFNIVAGMDYTTWENVHPKIWGRLVSRNS
jgi:hypothetical protein